MNASHEDTKARKNQETAISNHPSDGIRFHERIFKDRTLFITLILLTTSLLIQGIAILFVFESRIRFGSKFDPVAYSAFAAERSDASLIQAYGSRNRQETPLPQESLESDSTTLAMAKADQERIALNTRQKEKEVVQAEAERKALVLMSQADEFIKAGSYDKAISQTEKASQEAPDYLPATKKLAMLYEKQNDLTKARFQWEKASGMVSPQSPEMDEVQQNLDRLNKNNPGTRSTGDSNLIAAIHRDLPKNSSIDPTTNSISLTIVERNDLPLEDAFDLRFNLKITLGSRGSDPVMNIAQTVVDVTFFDQSTTAEGRLIPIKILNTTLQPKQTWATGSEQVLSLNYSVPRGFFRKRIQSFGSSYAFCGCVVKAYYCGKLQDVYAQPANVLEKYARTASLANESKP